MLSKLLLNTSNKVYSSWLIPSEYHGLRADQYLVARVGRISRERAARVILAGDFLLDGSKVKLSTRVKSGQKACLIRFAPDQTSDLIDQKINIIYEDNNILIINKPPGLSIHPTANCLYKTLTYWLRTNYPNQRINPCHRIDKDTSGLVLAAKNKFTESELKQQFMRQKIKKTYLAIVHGRPGQQTISLPLALQGDRGLVAIRMIKDLNGQKALTRIRLVHSVNKTLRGTSIERVRSLVMCRPQTGRQHQIRAHLSLIGCPIVGDKLYGHDDRFFDAWTKRLIAQEELEHPRHALHAYSLSFSLGSKAYKFTAPVPEDFCELMGQ